MEKENCKNTINIEEVKENIEKLSEIDQSLIPQYLDNIKQEKKIETKEITKDNPYYEFL